MFGAGPRLEQYSRMASRAARLLAATGGALPAASHVIFHSVDGYTTSLPLTTLLEAQTLLAWEMNGEPLPDRHGFPLRAVVRGSGAL